MRRAGRLAAEVLDALTPMVEPGVATEALDRFCHDYIVARGAVPAPLGYRGFPKSICTSVNHVVCHGIPGGKRLRRGDVLNVDVTVILDGWHGDTSRMFHVGAPGVKARRLVDLTYDAMMRGIAAVRPGAASLPAAKLSAMTRADDRRLQQRRARCLRRRALGRACSRG